ncbi:MAG: hypothetical protein NW237_14115 [Cyanobacteriota bacterium]|nr:hypothetical protein [Cyanobacteriota bacterium]
MNPQELQDKAWLGDAVLSLYAREWLLRHPLDSDLTRSQLFIRMTSNNFLSGLGDPTRIEAEIGLIYEQQGLTAAFQHIQEKILPLFLRQMAKRQRGLRGSR